MGARVWRIPRVVRVRGPLACYSLRESGDYTLHFTLHYIVRPKTLLYFTLTLLYFNYITLGIFLHMHMYQRTL